MTKKVLVQARLPAQLVNALDKLTQEGFYSNRTEAIADGVRQLVYRYSGGGNVAKAVRLYLMGKAPTDSSIDDVPEPDYERVRSFFLEQFGTDKAEEIIMMLRRGI
ncbi:MAG: ribbon-helix-helix domain-containing protein [Nitrososphaerota archaeon]